MKTLNSLFFQCTTITVFCSSIVLAENNKQDINIQPETDTEELISSYVGEEASNEFKQNMKKLDSYYEQINEKLHNNTPGNISEERVKKSLIKSINASNMNNIKTIQIEKFKKNNAINDKQLLDLMEKAGVDNNRETNYRNGDEKPIIRVYRDPFSLTRSLTGGGRLIEDSLPFAQKTFAEKMPKMVLKGIVKKPDGTRVALLELDDTVTYMVKENDRVGLSAIGLKMVIHIQEIHANTIIIEPGEINAGQEGEVIVVR